MIKTNKKWKTKNTKERISRNKGSLGTTERLIPVFIFINLKILEEKGEEAGLA
jgi:hypothetical protein